jgi:alginate O-acetyltransferase complex protein AlgI
VFGVGQIPRPHLDIILPPGISFYTFASISYVIDVYYERISACRSARDYTLFVTFFPKLLSGPIVRATEFLPQLTERARASAGDIEVGLGYFLLGAVKKLVIADQVAGHVSLIFSAPSHYDAPTLLMGVLGYTVQIYCDFSGYSDMAIGIARVLGYRFPQNFQMPYSSVTIAEFWRRWHITLSQWFRDYAFLPLEMATRDNPFPKVRMSLNLMIMMILVGLWHGPSWNFVIFGAIHGLALVIHQLWRTWSPVSGVQRNALGRFVATLSARILTLGVVILSFVFFRTQSLADAASYLNRMFLFSHGGIRMFSPYIFTALVVLLLVHLIVDKDRNVIEELPGRAAPVRILSYAALLLTLACFGATQSTPFIYFQF